MNAASPQEQLPISPVADYLEPTSKTVTIPAGQASATFSIDLVADSIVEATETVGLTLSAPMGCMLGLQNTATLSIMDDDSPFWTVALASSTSAITFSRC